MRRDNRIILLVFLALMAIGFGLTRINWSPGPRLYPVSGKLVIGGQPASKVQINFCPLDNKSQTASSQVDDEGYFEVYWGQEGRSGAQPGKYKVVLTQMAGSKAPIYKGPDAKRIPNMPPATFPPRYMSFDTSPEEYEVLKKNNVFEIALEMPAAAAAESE